MHPPPPSPGPAFDPEASIRHLPEAARACYREFRATGDLDSLDPLILAILESFLPRKSARSLRELPGDTRLMEDLGFDSLAMTEIVFFTEDLFGIRIETRELLTVRTIDDLRSFIRRKISTRATP
ncbi:MAG: hypothetical protein C0518_06445 [Opitutus sp.]|nr:hypothetical protein [Opitutus sp.]